MEKYLTYKDSGVQWLGKIPGHWNTVGLGRLLLSKLAYGASESGETYDQVNTVRYIRITDITIDGKLKQEGAKYLSKTIASGYPVKKGDILLARSGATVGKSFIYEDDKPACYAGYLIKASLNRDIIKPQFVFYYTQSSQYEEWKNRIFIQATIQNISAEKYARLSVPIPPISEQVTIVSYLNDKCTKLDQLVANKEKELELLLEMKQRVLTDAVTKGVNPNVRFKETGVSWLPRIPDHWTMPRVGNYFKLSDEKNNKSMEEVQLLSLYTDLGVFPHGEQKEKGNKAVTVDGYKVVHTNDIVVNIILSWMGAIGMSKYEGVTSPAYDVYRPDVMNVSPQYYHYLFRTKGFAGECLKNGRGIMMMRWRTYSTQFKQIRIPLPPLDEQMTIVSHINKHVEKVDILTEKLQKEIESIKEYKQRLISDVITGQIKVC